MITHNNLKEVINQLSDKHKKRIKNTDKEYCVLELHIFNAGSVTTCRLTDDFNRYKNVGNSGNCILESWDVAKLID